MALTKVLSFAASHRLASAALSAAENDARYGRCSRDHGHNYTLEVTVRGPVDEHGMVVDAALLEQAMRAAVVDLVDHRSLDRDVPALRGIVTTGENLVSAFFRLLEPALPSGQLWRVALVETENNRFECGPGAGE
jgi:6-pyruvoyltetrahydropterin/6-carboxytetrahydropterin synthase